MAKRWCDNPERIRETNIEAGHYQKKLLQQPFKPSFDIKTKLIPVTSIWMSFWRSAVRQGKIQTVTPTHIHFPPSFVSHLSVRYSLYLSLILPVTSLYHAHKSSTTYFYTSRSFSRATCRLFDGKSTWPFVLLHKICAVNSNWINWFTSKYCILPLVCGSNLSCLTANGKYHVQGIREVRGSSGQSQMCPLHRT
jgi:hypothetical protein